MKIEVEYSPKEFLDRLDNDGWWKLLEAMFSEKNEPLRSPSALIDYLTHLDDGTIGDEIVERATRIGIAWAKNRDEYEEETSDES